MDFEDETGINDEVGVAAVDATTKKIPERDLDYILFESTQQVNESQEAPPVS